MPERPVTLRAAGEEDLDLIVSTLAANDLPAGDVRSNPECFLVATSGPSFVGIAGLETYGSDGLLRSVVVDESRRGRGYGAALLDAVEAHARAEQVGTLYLLTTTAAAFFRRAGYAEIARESVPASIESTSEFAELCPSTATCMRKEI